MFHIHWLPWFRRHPRVLLTLTVGSEEHFSIFLVPGKDVRIMQTVTVGHKLTLGISYLDQNGNPMLTAPTPDAPATWSNTTPATETLVAAPDGNSAVATSVAPGTDVINLSVTVGGKAFAATLSVEVDPAPQVLTSVGITATVN